MQAVHEFMLGILCVGSRKYNASAWERECVPCYETGRVYFFFTTATMIQPKSEMGFIVSDQSTYLMLKVSPAIGNFA